VLSYLLEAPGSYWDASHWELVTNVNACALHIGLRLTKPEKFINDHMQLVGCSDPRSIVKLQLQCGSHVTILLDHILAFLSPPQ